MFSAGDQDGAAVVEDTIGDSMALGLRKRILSRSLAAFFLGRERGVGGQSRRRCMFATSSGIEGPHFMRTNPLHSAFSGKCHLSTNAGQDVQVREPNYSEGGSGRYR